MNSRKRKKNKQAPAERMLLVFVGTLAALERHERPVVAKAEPPLE